MRFGVFALMVMACGVTQTLVAQVGHDPESSPFHDLRASMMLTFTGGYIWRGEGTAGVGPTDGPLAGLRWDLRVGNPVWLQAAVYGSKLQRLLIDPDEPPATRDLGTADNFVTILDVGVNLVFTGRKTWHGLAPYIGSSLGLALGGEVPEDSSGFTFGTQFQASVSAGTMFFLSDRVNLRAEIRDIFWRLSYPIRFFEPPANAPLAPPVLDPNFNDNTEWVGHLVVMFGLGYAIKL